MLSKPAFLTISVSIFALQTLGDSDANAVNVVSDDVSPKEKSGDMPAGIVLLLLCMFISLGLICIRHVKREWAQQQKYILAKQAGMLSSASSSGIATKSYGSTLSPNLNSSNIDEYIDDQLFQTNIPIIDRLNEYRHQIQQRFINYMEETPEPVLFEANPDKSVGAYCKNPEIPKNPNYEPKPFKHSENYNPTPSPALQRMFRRNFEKNQQNKNKQEHGQQQDIDDGYNDIDDGGKFDDEYKEIENENKKSKKKRERKKKEKKKGFKTVKISLRHDMNMNFEDYDHGNYSGNEYDVIPDDNDNNHAYSDSDKNLSDADNGNNDENFKHQNDPPLLTKVVVLDLD